MEQKYGRKDGIKTATRDIVIEMLKNKMDDEIIKKISKIKQNDLEQIKKEIAL